MALVKIGKAAETLGVSVQTLHAWEASGELVPDRKSAGGTRYYDLAKLYAMIKPVKCPHCGRSFRVAK